MSSQSAPRRPAHLPFGRWLGDFGPLSAAEQKLVAACAKGEQCILSTERPESETKANTIRAELIRFLALGGDAENPVHEHGVALRGAWIVGTLNLKCCKVEGDLALLACKFPVPIIAYGANLAGLNLDGNAISGLKADRMRVSGGIFLRNGFSSIGEVRLLGATIGGDLDCSNGHLANENGKALSADGSKIGGSCFFNNGFTAKGEVRLPDACIGGTLICTESHFENEKGNALSADRIKVSSSVFLRDGFSSIGDVRLVGATIGGDLDCSGGHFANEEGNALSADRIKIAGSCFLSHGFTAKGQVSLIGAYIDGQVLCSKGRFNKTQGHAINAQACIIKSFLTIKLATMGGSINLRAAQVGTLADGEAGDEGAAPACWGGSEHILDGFTYDRISGASDAKTRIAWLKTQRPEQLTNNDWAPQPWEQLIKVLREMGHPHEAAKVAIEKQRMMRKAGKVGKPARFAAASTPMPAVTHLLAWMRDGISGRMRNMLHHLSGALIGHGYDVTWAMVALLAMMGGAGSAYQYGYENGYFGPTNAVIQMNYHNQCGAPGDVMDAPGQKGDIAARPKKHWNAAACTPPEYTSFQPWLYSLDLILPVVNLGQDSDWAPMVSNARQQDLWWGQALRALVIVEILFGWGLTLLIAAVMTNLIKKD
ncbi:UNVERIFIED_ORG: hypothetical protein M2348_000973 [Sphingomonas sp. R1F5B]